MRARGSQQEDLDDLEEDENELEPTRKATVEIEVGLLNSDLAAVKVLSARESSIDATSKISMRTGKASAKASVA